MRRLTLGPAVALAFFVFAAPQSAVGPSLARPAAFYGPRAGPAGESAWQARWNRRWDRRWNRRWDGRFDRRWRSEHPTPPAASWDHAVASWYYDQGSTACGFHAAYGVANLSLACGMRVAFSYGGREVEAVVDDRGPYVTGRTWDLSQTTAAALGFAGVGEVAYRVG